MGYVAFLLSLIALLFTWWVMHVTDRAIGGVRVDLSDMKQKLAAQQLNLRKVAENTGVSLPD